MLSPLDIEMKEFKKNLGGYNKEDVDEFMRILLQDYKEIYMENVSMKDKLGTLTAAVSRYKSMEDVMQNTLIVAQSTSDEVKKAANTKAQAIVEEAETRAREILMDSKHRLSQINMELEQMKLVMAGYKKQIRSILQAGMEMIEKIPQAEGDTPQPNAAAEQNVNGAPTEQTFTAVHETEEERLRREETVLHIRQAMEQQQNAFRAIDED